MQRDPLEKFILQNRESFDDQTPSLKVWAGIERAISGARRRRLAWVRTLAVAASVLVLLLAGGFMGAYINSNYAQPQASALETVDPEFGEMERYYQREIQSKLQQLASYDQAQSVRQDVAQLDEAMSELKQELRDAPEGREEEIVQNLIQNYRAKLLILERVLERIQNTKQENSKPTDDEVNI